MQDGLQTVSVKLFYLYCRFSNLFEIVEKGELQRRQLHPKFKIRQLKCLNKIAQNNAMAAIKNGIVGCNAVSSIIKYRTFYYKISQRPLITMVLILTMKSKANQIVKLFYLEITAYIAIKQSFNVSVKNKITIY